MKKERLWNIKWRIVFDASSSEGYSPSLNDVLEMRLNLLPEVLETLLRFRGHSVSVIGDIFGTGSPKTIKATATPHMLW